MASNTSQSDSQGWWQKVKNLGVFTGATVGATAGATAGVTAGIVVGTMTLPVFGTAIGFLGGGLLGAYFVRNLTPYENYLNKQGWVAFGIQRNDVGPEGETIPLQPKADSRIQLEGEDVIKLEVPKDAVRRPGGGKLPIRHCILLNGKVKLEPGYKLVSPVVYVSYDQKDTTKPLKLKLPHWSSDENIFIATAPQDNNEEGDITFKLKDEIIDVSSSSKNAVVSSISGSELYAVAVREEAKSNFYAIPHEIKMDKGGGVEFSVIISYASSVWCEILHEHYFPKSSFPSCLEFKFSDSSIRPRLAEDGGPGWKAKLCGYSEIGLKHIDKNTHDIKDGDQLKKALAYKRYPPRFTYKVNWTEEAEVSRQQRQVEVFIDGCDQELSFSCMTFEAPAPDPSKVHVSSNPEKGSYSNVKARDVFKKFKLNDLIKDIKDMLTRRRVYILERQYKLINYSCNAKIRSDLEKGDPNSAAITLIEYFEANHNGDGMLRFCTFLRDEAEEAGGSAALEDLADRIEIVIQIQGLILGPF